ncbi:PAS domain S-box protein [Paraburkholderia caribensis]|uniref:PAS domain S-box protein n=2 Tax=Paraburkholderia caribensis TaxID=75105 RepID=A0ABV0E369_9BURK|nr:PAS domain S-box protein [Paraburkholderia caribensis]PTB26276.1 PAS domain S-box protein [Paraburkholderia caribensis]
MRQTTTAAQHEQHEHHEQHDSLRAELDTLRGIIAAQHALLQARNLTFNHTDVAAYLIKQDGRLLYASDEAHRTLGYSALEFETLRFEDIDLDWTGETWRRGLQRLREHGALCIQTTHRRKDSSAFCVQVNCCLLECGSSSYCLALAREVTNRTDTPTGSSENEGISRSRSQDYIARYDRQFRRIYANPALLAAFSNRAERVLGTTPSELSLFLDPSEYMVLLGEVMDSGIEVVKEMRCRDRTGRVRWGHMRLIPEFDPMHNVVGVLTIYRDIDGLKRSEELFRTLAENFPDQIVRFDSRCRCLYVNIAASRFFKIPQEEFFGKRPSEIALLAETTLAERGEDMIRSVIETGCACTTEVDWQSLYGDRKFEVRLIPEKERDGRVTNVLWIARDITKLRATELALLESERAFRTLVENSPDPIIRYDLRGLRLYVNPKFESMFGINSRDILVEHIYTVGEESKVVQRRLDHILGNTVKNNEKSNLELIFTFEGKKRYWHAYVSPERGTDGVISSVLMVWRDITERKESESRLRDSYCKLRELAAWRETAREEDRRRIARELHDELGQYLTTLKMRLSAMRINLGSNNEDLATELLAIVSISDKTIQVMRDVVTSLRPAAIDFGIVGALQWLITQFSKNNSILCNLSLPQDDVGLEEDRSVALFRVTQEALTNIVRHASARSVTISLEIENNDCFLEVRDDGRGFDPETIQRNSFGILGMRERVVMLGGEILVKSSLGLGTTIRVRVPLTQSPRG